MCQTQFEKVEKNIKKHDLMAKHLTVIILIIT